MRQLAPIGLLALLAACSPTPPQTPEPAPAPAPADVPAAPAAAPATPATAPEPGPGATAKRAPGDEAGPMEVFRAFGTEPFWNVNVEGNTLRYTTPEDPAGIALTGERMALAKGRLEINGTHAGRPFTLVVKGGDCNDGMSDNRYQHVATFTIDGKTLKGCAEEAK